MMPGDPATELLEQLSRLPARDAYEMQQKEKVVEYARALVAENERLRDLVPTAYSGGFNDAKFNRPFRLLPASFAAKHDECWERSPVRQLLNDITGVG